MASMLAKKSLQRLNPSNDHYWEMMNNYLRVSDRQEALRLWMEKEFEPKVVSNLYRNCGKEIGRDGSLFVLGVGSCDGYIEMIQLNKLMTKFPNLTVYAVEPSREKLSQYKDMVSKNDSKIRYEWRNQTFQEYLTTEGTTQKYHFISMVHVIYYVGELDTALKNLYDMLQTGGILVIVGVSLGRKGIGEILKMLRDLTETITFTTATEVKEVLQKLHIPFSQSEYTERADITSLMNKEDSRRGDLLLDVLTGTADFNKLAPHHVRQNVLSHLRKHAIVEKGGKEYYFQTVMDIFIITKSD